MEPSLKQYIEEAIASAKRDDRKGRELALVLTKLEEALLWESQVKKSEA